jgi:hypothetical protein
MNTLRRSFVRISYYSGSAFKAFDLISITSESVTGYVSSILFSDVKNLIKFSLFKAYSRINTNAV